MMTIALVHYGSTSNLWNSPAQTLVIGTTAQGNSTKGIMADWRNFDPAAWLDYQRLCVSGKVQVGIPVLIRSQKHQGKQYILCPIKANSGDAPSLNAVNACIKFIWENGSAAGITSIATHKMGAGRGEEYLKWAALARVFMTWFGRMPVPVAIHVGANDYLPTAEQPQQRPPTAKRETNTGPLEQPLIINVPF